MASMKKKKEASYIWVEKYRPQTVKSTLLPVGFKKAFNKIIADGECPNMLLYSSTPGSGKTTIAKAIARDLGIKPLYINVSAKSGIDTLRSDIERHATTMALKGNHKIVILDEFDYATPQLQAGLRAFIEQYAKTCRFIITCNFISKIITPLREGRMMEFDFNMTDKKLAVQMKPKIVKRLETILSNEEVEHAPGILGKLVDAHYPSIRKMLSILQKYNLRNGVIDENIFNTNELDDEFYDMILQNKLTDARKYVIERSFNYEELYIGLFRNFIPLLEPGKRAEAYIIIADYQYKHVFAIDPEITFTACLVEIMGIE